MKKTLDICSAVVLLLCIVAILWCGVLLVNNNSKQTIVKHKIQLAVLPDTLGIIPKDVHLAVDSLQAYIQTTEQRITDRYEYFLEQKSEENVLFSIGSVILGVFISILGFFGYKSFKDIEVNAEDHARVIAADAAEKYLRNNLPTYVDTKLTSITNNLNKTVNLMVQENVKSEISAVMEEIKEDIDLLKMYVNEQNKSNQDNVEHGEVDDLFE